MLESIWTIKSLLHSHSGTAKHKLSATAKQHHGNRGYCMATVYLETNANTCSSDTGCLMYTLV